MVYKNSISGLCSKARLDGGRVVHLVASIYTYSPLLPYQSEWKHIILHGLYSRVANKISVRILSSGTCVCHSQACNLDILMRKSWFRLLDREISQIVVTFFFKMWARLSLTQCCKVAKVVRVRRLPQQICRREHCPVGTLTGDWVHTLWTSAASICLVVLTSYACDTIRATSFYPLDPAGFLPFFWSKCSTHYLQSFFAWSWAFVNSLPIPKPRFMQFCSLPFQDSFAWTLVTYLNELQTVQ